MLAPAVSRRSWTCLFGVIVAAIALAAFVPMTAAAKTPATPESDYQPDPLSVVREGAGYRYPQAGWIVVHIEGPPYERGYQHGKLLSAEIVEYVRALGHAP